VKKSLFFLHPAASPYGFFKCFFQHFPADRWTQASLRLLYFSPTVPWDGPWDGLENWELLARWRSIEMLDQQTMILTNRLGFYFFNQRTLFFKIDGDLNQHKWWFEPT